jgi:hypothetical protein
MRTYPKEVSYGQYYTCYNAADLTISPESTIGTFVDDTAVVATDSDQTIASQKL